MLKIILDTEANGKSIISFSAILIDKDNQIIDTIDRYYMPVEGEKFDYFAAKKIHKLFPKTIIKYREEGAAPLLLGNNRVQNATYALHFHQDEEILDLLNKADIIIGHNIRSDNNRFKNAFLERIKFNTKNIFCTQFNSREYLQILDEHGHPKSNGLKTCIEHLNINIVDNKGEYHSSLFDTVCTFELYKKILELKTKNIKPIIIDNFKEIRPALLKEKEERLQVKKERKKEKEEKRQLRFEKLIGEHKEKRQLRTEKKEDSENKNIEIDNIPTKLDQIEKLEEKHIQKVSGFKRKM